jgi:hypothetical protein
MAAPSDPSRHVPPRTGFSPVLRTGPPTPPPATAQRGEKRGSPEDPLRATLLETLRLLNKAEDFDHEEEKGLELAELEFQASDFWAVVQAQVKIPFVVGLLLRNRMVRYIPGGAHSWTRQRAMGPHYRIDTAGKDFLAQSIAQDGRIA